MIISISGNNMNSGKDLVGKIIQKLTTPKGNGKRDQGILRSSWQIKKFAGLPNEIYKSIKGIDFHSLSRIDKEEEREEFIFFCEHLKLWDTDIWVNSLMKGYRPQDDVKGVLFTLKDGSREFVESKLSYPNWIITDLRFSNEYQAVQKRNGLHIHLERFKVGDLVVFSNSNVRVYKINHLSEKSCELTSIDGNYQTNAYYSELSIVKNDTHKSENTELLKEFFDENVVYLYNIENIDELIEKVKSILENHKII